MWLVLDSGLLTEVVQLLGCTLKKQLLAFHSLPTFRIEGRCNGSDPSSYRQEGHWRECRIPRKKEHEHFTNRANLPSDHLLAWDFMWKKMNSYFKLPLFLLKHSNQHLNWYIQYSSNNTATQLGPRRVYSSLRQHDQKLGLDCFTQWTWKRRSEFTKSRQCQFLAACGHCSYHTKEAYHQKKKMHNANRW